MSHFLASSDGTNGRLPEFVRQVGQTKRTTQNEKYFALTLTLLSLANSTRHESTPEPFP